MSKVLKNKIFPSLIFSLSLMLTSCSSMNSTLIYGGVSGAAVGGIAGNTLSPNKESDVFNTALWGVVGAFIGSGIAYLLRADDPDNQEMKQMIRRDMPPQEPLKLSDDFGFKVIKASESNSYIIPDQTLPERLKGLVKKQIITEHIVNERIEKKEGGKTVIYPETKVYEYDYQ
jgi:uncharacterized membrane protein YeaQ/YmgE (transglycosylase-associated protein family)